MSTPCYYCQLEGSTCKACIHSDKYIGDKLIDAGKAVVERWDSPKWKDLPHTAEYINELRNVIAEIEEATK